MSPSSNIPASPAPESVRPGDDLSQHRIVFLDIDGVLNNPGCYSDLGRKASGTHARPLCYAIDALNRITDETEALIVVSSTWRLAMPFCELYHIMKSWGIRGQIIGSTPKSAYNNGVILVSQSRGGEINAWLKDHEVASFVILDDETNLAPVGHWHVQIAGSVGLTMENADEAIAMFHSPLSANGNMAARQRHAEESAKT
jgi:HAD domain in Swiss Army Knife RNA repair proteins